MTHAFVQKGSALFAGVLACFVCSAAVAAKTPLTHATSAGGSHQVTALQGCMNQWLFNGVWRVKVTKVAPYADQFGLPGYKVTFEVRNGSTRATSFLKTAVSDHPGHLVFDDGNELTGGNTDAILAWNGAQFKELPPSGFMTFTVPFLFQPKPDTVPKPVKWLLEINPAKEWAGAPRYTTSNPNLRVNLTCDKASHS